MSPLDGKNLPGGEENTDDYQVLVLPFMNSGNNTEKNTPEREPSKAARDIAPEMGSISPLQALKNSVKQTVEQGQQEQLKSAPAAEPEKSAEKVPVTPSPKDSPAEKRPKKTSSLLAKCMPYIYDDEGNSYAEEKPDYTLESVEDIIESAEKRANEKIARMYNLRPDDVQRIGGRNTAEQPKAEGEARPKLRLEETSIKKPLKIGDVSKTTSKIFDTVSIPKVSTTLFDDFSARRTDVSGSDNITTPYSSQGGMTSPDEGRTRIIPDLKPDTDNAEFMEDVMSHTRPMNIEDISSSSKKQPVRISDFTEEAPEIEVDDFKGKEDISRVGSSLKFDLFSARLRLVITFFLTLAASSVHLSFINEAAGPMMLSIIAIVAFGLAMIVNFNVFIGFKGAFTRGVKTELPLALAGTVMTVYFVYSIITGNYPYEPAAIPLLSFLVYDWCAYRKAHAIFNNFKLVASRKTKKALALIDDSSVTSAMARSVISGEVLAAGQRETDEIEDFLKNTLSDRPLAGKLNAYAAVTIAAAAVIALAVGMGLASFSAALLAAAIVFCLGAAPSLFIADMLPFAGMSDRLFRLRAAVCSKFSAQKIGQINAAVVSSRELFPDGCIKLYNMTPLSANTLDETIILAASVALAADSPLFPMLDRILTDDTVLPEADSVKYEDSLGISGWVGNNHIMIGNRSLMQAHGVRVPALDVDRKILHKGYFPVYIACDQRACALLVTGYSTDPAIEAELGRLSDKGITLLVNNCDPNITEQMLCDYYSLYPDLVKILDHNGAAKYADETAHAAGASAHGFHRGELISFLTVITSSIRLHTLSGVLYVLHIIMTVVMWLLFAVMSLGGSLSVMSAALCVLCELICTVISMTAYFVGK